MQRARWSVTRHNGTWKQKIPTEWSIPHQSVMGMLARHGIRILTEQRMDCEPCDNPLCHHSWKADILLVDRPIIIEVHRPKNDELKQAIRKHCFESNGYSVIPIDDYSALTFPELVLPKIMSLEQLTEAGVIVLKESYAQ